MHPTVRLFGRYTLNSYTLLLDLGLLLACGVVVWRARRRVARPARWIDGLMVALAAGVLAARLAYVGANWAYYQQHRNQILRFWRGGLNWHGALVGVLLGVLLYSWIKRLHFWRLADHLALVAPLIGFFGWLGCLMVGVSFGRELSSPHPLAADLPDLFGEWALRVNVQLLAAGWSALTGLLLWALNRQPRPPGMIASLFLLVYGLGMGLIDPWRGDVVPMWSGRRADVWLDWGIVTLGLILLLVRFFRSRSLPKQS